MRVSPAPLVLVVAAQIACQVSVPDLPAQPYSGPGAVYGQVVTARPGRADRLPAPGTAITLVGTSLGTVADAEGRFRLEGIVDRKGSLLFQFTGDVSGGRLRQKLVRLESLGAGPGREIAIGELTVTENARIVGRARRGDHADRAGGHGGIQVYVPEAPFLTQTADDGSFVLDTLPEGQTVVALRADGYASRSLDGLVLRGGEELVLAEQILDAQVTAPQTGAIRGTVQLAEPAADDEPVLITCVASDGTAHATTAHAATDGSVSFEVTGLPSGIYNVLVGRMGYTTAHASNVLVDSGSATTLSATVLLQRATTPPPACETGRTCRAPDPCRKGLTTCVSDVELCEGQQEQLAPGASCGTNRVCGADGACRACSPGAACTPTNACHLGRLECGTGEPACVDTGALVEAGTGCGPGAVCSSAGECLACEGGQVCDAGNCRLGAITCASGTPECHSLELQQPAGHACGDDRVCAPDGACVACVVDEACTPSNRCRTGRRACDSGTARCLETELAVEAGTPCADDRVCDGEGACVPCIEGAACSPENPCRAGTISCGSGTPVCHELATPGPAGTPCAAGKVCSGSGECVACALGTLCEASECRLGSIACDTGAPTCRENGLLALSGEGCGEGRVCDPAGACHVCVAGGACVPANVCRKGEVSCSTGVQRCVETGAATAAGTECAAGRVCDGFGACVTCNEDAACVPDDAPCELGKISCAGGAPKCQSTGQPRPAGFTCSAGRVCSSAGTCDACTEGESCVPGGETCRTGRTTCASGAPVCQASATFAATGSTCATDKVCSSTGACVSCVEGTTCTPADPCRRGAIACASGGPRCEDAGAARPAGSTCGTDRVCTAAGACIACEQGATCTPANPCVAGTLDCATGAPVCVASASTIADGTVCGTKQVCRAGTCAACDSGAACAPANPCHVGAIACGTGTAVCGDTGANVAEGTTCGTAKVCKAGTCLASGLTIVSGDAQEAAPAQLLPLPVVLELRDGTGNTLSGKTITLGVPSGSHVSQGTTLTTNGAGRVTFNWRLGWLAGGVTLTATAPSESATATVKATVVLPAPGTITTVANVSRSNVVDRSAGPASVGTLLRPVAFARASNDTLYVLDNGGVVRKVAPDGSAVLVAGGGSAGSPGYGDGGAATNAQFSAPRGLALDENRGILFVSDSGIARTRAIDLTAGTITAFAGNGNANSPAGPGYGDGGSAMGASFWYMGWLGLTPDRKLLIADGNHALVRRVDPDSGLIDSLVAPPVGGCNAVPAGNVNFQGCGSYDYRACQGAWDSAGNFYLWANACYQNGSAFNAILRRDTSGRYWLVAGNPSYQAPADGVGGAAVSLAGPASVAVDAGGNVYFADLGTDANQNRLRRVDVGTGRVRILGGNGTAGFGGDGGPVSGAIFNEPSGLLFDAAGNLLVADSGNFVVRRIERLGRSSSVTLELSSVAGSTQSAPVTRQAPSALTMKVSDSTQAVFPGAKVTWKAVDPGGAVYTPSASADAAGQASTLVRAGLKPGTYRFEASVADLLGRPPPGGPLAFSITATAPGTGTLFGAVNVARSAGSQRGPVAATIAQTGTLQGVALASDGTFYVADDEYDVVYRVSAAGELTLFAGTPGSWGFSGDGGLATAAQLRDPSDVAISADGATLYIADSTNHRIRAVNLATNVITTYAGGGNQASYPYGDGGPAANAVLATPSQLAIGPDSALYFRDRTYGTQRVRRIDAATTAISEFWLPTYNYCNAGAFVISDCSYLNTEGACNMAFDAHGNAYLTTQVCGTSLGSTGNFTWGVVKRTPGGVVSWFAGHAAGSTSAPAGLHAVTFEVPPFVTFDANDNVYFVERDKHRIRRYDAVTQLVSPWAGNGTAGFGAEEGPLGAALLNLPRRVVVDPNGHVYVPDAGNRTVRLTW